MTMDMSDIEVEQADEYDDSTDGNGNNRGGGGGPRYDLPFLYDRPLSEYDIVSHIELAVQRTDTLLSIVRNFAARKRLPTDRSITVGGFRRLIPLPALHTDPHAREWVPQQDLYLHLVIRRDQIKDGDIELEPGANPAEFDSAKLSLVVPPPAANGGGNGEATDLAPEVTLVDYTTDENGATSVVTQIGVIAPEGWSTLPEGYVMVARPMRWFTPDGMKPERSSRGTTGRNLIDPDDVQAYFQLLLETNGLEVYGTDAFDGASDAVRWRVRQLFWTARKWAMQGPANWVMDEWIDNVPADYGWFDEDGKSTPPDGLRDHDNWRMGSFCFSHINDRYRKFIAEGGTRETTFLRFYQMVPSEYFARWQFIEALARKCRNAVEGQDVQEAVDAYIDMQDMFSAVDRGAWIEKLIMVSKDAGGEPRAKSGFLKIHRATAITRYCSIYEADDDNKIITGIQAYLEQLQLMEEMSMPQGKPVSARGDWYGSALRDQRAKDWILLPLYYSLNGDGDRVLPAQFLDPRFYLGERLGMTAALDFEATGTEEYRTKAGPHVFLNHSNLNLELVESARNLRDLGLSASGGRLTLDAVEKASGDMVEWNDLVRVYKVVTGKGKSKRTRYYSTDDPDNPRQLVAMMHPTDEIIDIDPMWVLQRGDSLFYKTWPERMAKGWWEMGFPRELGIDTRTWDNYGLHRTLARAAWWLQPLEPIERVIDDHIAEAKENHETDLLSIFLKTVAGFPSGAQGRDDIEKMFWKKRWDIFEWMEDRMAEQHNMISLRQFRDFISWMSKGMWQRVGDSPEVRMEGMKRLKALAFWLYMSAKAGDTLQGKAEADDWHGKMPDADFTIHSLRSRSMPWSMATGGKDRKNSEHWQTAERYEIAFRLQDAGLPETDRKNVGQLKGVTAKVAEKIRAAVPDDQNNLDAWESAWEEVRSFILEQLLETELTENDIDFRMIRSWYYTFHSLLVV